MGERVVAISLAPLASNSAFDRTQKCEARLMSITFQI